MVNQDDFITVLEKLLTYLKVNSNNNQQTEQIQEHTLGDIAKILATKFQTDYDTFSTWVNKLYKINPGACVSLFAKELAIILDANYPDHITEHENFYILSLSDGCIHECNVPIKNHECIALFRTLDDAKYACKVLKPWLKDIYGKQKNKKHK